jgi:hypothetical protein
MIGRLMIFLLIVLALLSIYLGATIMFDGSKEAIDVVSQVNLKAGEYLKNLEKNLIGTVNKNRGIDLLCFGITWFALAYLGIKVNKNGGDKK